MTLFYDLFMIIIFTQLAFMTEPFSLEIKLQETLFAARNMMRFSLTSQNFSHAFKNWLQKLSRC